MNKAEVVLLRGQPFDPSRHTLIFTHIPKCGGTSLHKTLGHALGEPRYRVFTGLAEQRENLDDLIGGGGHQKFGTNPLHQNGRQVVYVTMLREPFARFCSFFHHVRWDHRHFLRKQNPAVARMAPLQLIDYLDEIGNPSVRDFQTAMLAPYARTAEQAIMHIERNYSIIGILENMPSFMASLSAMFPGAELGTYDLNKTTTFIEPMRLDSPRLMDKVLEISRLDYAIYSHFSKTAH